MFKFKYKKHVHEQKESGKIIVYYNVADLILGLVLMILVIFFIHDYLSHSLQKPIFISNTPTMNSFSNGFFPVNSLDKKVKP